MCCRGCKERTKVQSNALLEVVDQRGNKGQIRIKNDLVRQFFDLTKTEQELIQSECLLNSSSNTITNNDSIAAVELGKFEQVPVNLMNIYQRLRNDLFSKEVYARPFCKRNNKQALFDSVSEVKDDHDLSCFKPSGLHANYFEKINLNGLIEAEGELVPCFKVICLSTV